MYNNFKYGLNDKYIMLAIILMACQITRPDTAWYFLWRFVKVQVYRTSVCDLADLYKKEFILLSTMSHHRYFITHGSRLNTGLTFPVPLMEVMLRFMEHEVKNSQVSLFVANCFISRFVLVQKLYLFIFLYLLDGPGSSSGKTLCYGLDGPGSSPVPEGWRFFFIHSCPDWSWGPLNLL